MNDPQAHQLYTQHLGKKKNKVDVRQIQGVSARQAGPRAQGSRVQGFKTMGEVHGKHSPGCQDARVHVHEDKSVMDFYPAARVIKLVTSNVTSVRPRAGCRFNSERCPSCVRMSHLADCGEHLYHQ